jgi:hypothetical protein
MMKNDLQKLHFCNQKHISRIYIFTGITYKEKRLHVIKIWALVITIFIIHFIFIHYKM